MMLTAMGTMARVMTMMMLILLTTTQMMMMMMMMMIIIIMTVMMFAMMTLVTRCYKPPQRHKHLLAAVILDVESTRRVQGFE